jgi:hypothetical protein
MDEVSTALPPLDFAGIKMLKLEEVVGDQLEAEGRVLAEHVLICFQSRDPQVSITPQKFQILECD